MREFSYKKENFFVKKQESTLFSENIEKYNNSLMMIYHTKQGGIQNERVYE